MTVDPGQVRLHRRADPALDAGLYHVSLTGHTSAGDADTHDAYFRVTGPQLRLEPADVAAMSPPEKAAGDFGAELPYVALTRRTLPWERTGSGGGPWLALLITTDAEATPGDGPLSEAGALAGVAPTTTVSLLRVLPAGAAVVRAQLGALAVRAHVREVSLADTATMGPDDDGWQAVVLGARLPAGAADPGTPYRATLVSLEPAGAAAPSAFLALHRWTFTSTSEGGSFAYLVSNLGVARFAPGPVQLEAVDRGGATRTVACRSPLSDQGDAPEGVEDVTRTAAFELGRMLAAADGRLLRELVAWRRRRQWEATGQVTDRALEAMLGAAPRRLPTAGPRRRGDRVSAAMLAALHPSLPAADRFDTAGLAPAAEEARR